MSNAFFKDMSGTEKTKFLTDKLSEYHSPLESSFWPEIRVGGGYGRDSEQRLDGWAIYYTPSKQNHTVGYEIKASRSDLMSELKKPLKRRKGLLYSNKFYFVVPKGLAKVEEIPPECGLMEFDENGVMTVAIHAPFRDIHPLPRNFIASLLRRLDKERLYNFLKNMDENEWIQETGNIVLQVLIEHLDKWTNYAQGDKTVPDKVAAALRDVRQDVIQAMIDKRIMR